MPTNIVIGSTLEFIAEIFDANGVRVTPPVEVFLQIAYTDTLNSSQVARIPMLGLDGEYIGHWSAPTTVSKKTMAQMSLSLTASGAFPISPPDPFLRLVG